MKVEEYLYMCLVFSIVFVVHSVISYASRPARALGHKLAPSHPPLLRVNLARPSFQ
jgi:hypothetical protein